MITTQLILHYEPFIKVLLFVLMVLLFIDILLIVSMRWIVREFTQLEVRFELFKRGHVDHTQDDLDRFIEEYRKGLKHGIHNKQSK